MAEVLSLPSVTADLCHRGFQTSFFFPFVKARILKWNKTKVSLLPAQLFVLNTQ